jgi:hypothetical protein
MKYAVTIERQAWDQLTFHVEANDHNEAEAVVQAMIDLNDLERYKSRAPQVLQECIPDDESCWEIVDTGAIP